MTDTCNHELMRCLRCGNVGCDVPACPRQGFQAGLCSRCGHIEKVPVGSALGTAESIARRAHHGQKDKVGMPYFETHVLDVYRRVLEAGGDEDQQVAALLHDTLEDTTVTERDLRAHGVSDGALRIVLLMTKGSDTDTYLARLSEHEPARRVKLADIASNTDPERLWRVAPSVRRTLLAKYAGYLRALGEDDAQLRRALDATPDSETDAEREERLEHVFELRCAAALDALVEETDFVRWDDIDPERQRGRSS